MPTLGALLCALALPAQGGGQGPAGLAALTAEWKAAQAEYRAATREVQNSAEYKAAREAKDNSRLRELAAKVKLPDAQAFGERALALAAQCEGEDQLAVLAAACSTFASKDVVTAAVARVAEEHIGSAGIVGLLENGMNLIRFLGAEAGNAFLDRVVAENKNALPRAWAMYWKGYQVQRSKNASGLEKAAAERLLADAELLAAGTALAERIAAPRFEQERLQVGMVVPELEGTDVEGVAFALGDYRGKVVLIDFWGFW